ncbi:MAG: di-heme oxidoredictase family protein [Gammaproteobacteria bacterium]|nr:di-heme oxidoredictase family protein [Gammaproteobacteria bacterium]MDP6616891.1 di-heme oxidoredictase family protein [Gammaproteobacteria bacterium]MDP6694549.1 di-heme oxidoredictase family protein [Gammaproteobacteria bacterium]MDP7041592.1 di-heme oxidoredictase family protein [Gammaproteobacteria bacterium]
MKRSLFGTLVIFLALANGAGAQALRASFLKSPQSPELGGAATVDRADITAFKQMIPNAGPMRFPQFMFGQRQFVSEWDPAPGEVPDQDGLGPTFNAIACASCHINNGRGFLPADGEDFESVLVRFSVPGDDGHGGPKPLANYGGQFQHRAVDGVQPEGNAHLEWEYFVGYYTDGTPFRARKPKVVFSQLAFGELPADMMVSLRTANPVIGLGLLERVPAETLLDLADPDDSNGDGISGRMNIVWDAKQQRNAPGRFGWKANVPTVELQNAGAALGDMGVTTAINPDDNCPAVQDACLETAALHPPEAQFRPEFFEQLTRYVLLTAVPRQRNADDVKVMQGRSIFYSSGCVQCHMPTLKTGDSEGFPELANQTIHPFTDLLLHDMGEGLEDGRPDYLASGSEWRTPPLWGIGLTETVSAGQQGYLHDGRARTLEEAILWHGGEAKSAQRRFRALSKKDRAVLLSFLKSL